MKKLQFYRDPQLACYEIKEGCGHIPAERPHCHKEVAIGVGQVPNFAFFGAEDLVIDGGRINAQGVMQLLIKEFGDRWNH